MTGDQFEDVRDALATAGCRPGSGDASFTARCPAHEDRNPSLTVSRGDRQPVVVNCHAGCSSDTVVSALGLAWSDVCEPREVDSTPAVAALSRVVDRYGYCDENGELLFTVERRDPKSFSQRPASGKTGPGAMDGVQRVLYALPRVIAAVDRGETIYLVEGEKDVAALEGIGLTANHARRRRGSV